MKNQPEALKSHKNRPGTMKTQSGTVKNHKKPTWSCTGWLQVVTGLQGGSDDFSLQIDKQTLHQNIY